MFAILAMWSSYLTVVCSDGRDVEGAPRLRSLAFDGCQRGLASQKDVTDSLPTRLHSQYMSSRQRVVGPHSFVRSESLCLFIEVFSLLNFM